MRTIDSVRPHIFTGMLSIFLTLSVAVTYRDTLVYYLVRSGDRHYPLLVGALADGAAADASPDASENTVAMCKREHGMFWAVRLRVCIKQCQIK